MYWSWSVTEEFDGVRADKGLSEAIQQGQGIWTDTEPQSFSRSQIKKLLDDGKISSLNQPITGKSKLKIHQEVQIQIPTVEKLNLEPQSIPIEILFQDSHLAIINKPAGLTTHPSETQKSQTLVNALLYHLKDLSGIGGIERPGIVHRLDRDTSGVMVVAKTNEAHQKLSEMIAHHDFERRYWAFCYGSPKEKNIGEEFILEGLIGRNPKDRKKMAFDVSGGRTSKTYFRTLIEYGVSGQYPFASKIEARLETGRTHQVRVHLTHLTHSLLGDPIYGVPSSKQNKWKQIPNEVKEAVQKLPGQALHARLLAFDHPITKKEIRIEADPGKELIELIQVLESFNRMERI